MASSNQKSPPTKLSADRHLKRTRTPSVDDNFGADLSSDEKPLYLTRQTPKPRMIQATCTYGPSTVTPEPSTMPKIESKKSITVPAFQNSPTTTMRLAFGETAIDPVPANTPALYFKIEEYVTVRMTQAEHPHLMYGAVVTAVAWKKDLNSYIYKLNGGTPASAFTFKSYYEQSRLTASRYTVGDVVRVKAFGTQSDHTVQKVHASSGGTLTYEIAAGFRVRDEDVSGLVARCRSAGLER